MNPLATEIVLHCVPMSCAPACGPGPVHAPVLGAGCLFADDVADGLFGYGAHGAEFRAEHKGKALKEAVDIDTK